jgi:hypothetical protein
MSATLIDNKVYINNVCVGRLDLNAKKYRVMPQTIPTKGEFYIIRGQKFYVWDHETLPDENWVMFVN